MVTRRQTKCWTAIGVAVVTLIAVWVFQPAEPPVPGPPPPGMALIPAGPFTMGTNDPSAPPDEHPRRSVDLPAYYIDLCEVTNAQFRAWRPTHVYPDGAENLPVTAVSRADAEAYARSLGKRLPTAAEWEKAARGTDGRSWPWGDRFEPDRANVRQPGEPGPRPVAVGSYPGGASPYGCLDMAGNVWEWVSDTRHDGGVTRGVLRGGASRYVPDQARTTAQGFEDPETTCHDVGFRCAMDAK